MKILTLQSITKKLSLAFIAFVIAMIIPASFVQQARAFGGTSFGGMRLYAMSCTCSGNQIIYINDYKSGGTLALIYQSGTQLYSNSNIMGTYLLGQYQSGGGTCEMYAGEDCIEWDSDGQISFAGTS